MSTNHPGLCMNQHSHAHWHPVLCSNLHSHIHCLLWTLQFPELPCTLLYHAVQCPHDIILCRPCVHIASVPQCSLQVTAVTPPLPLQDLSRHVQSSDPPPTADVCRQLLSQSHCPMCLVQTHALTCTRPAPLSACTTIPHLSSGGTYTYG